MKNIRTFYLKIFIFMVVKFSVYLNRHVFVMVFVGRTCQNVRFLAFSAHKLCKLDVRCSSPFLLRHPYVG